MTKIILTLIKSREDEISENNLKRECLEEDDESESKRLGRNNFFGAKTRLFSDDRPLSETTK